MQRMQRGVVLAMVLSLCASGTLLAQGSTFRAADNPYQEGFAYSVGQALAPNVEIDGVRWSLVRVAPRGDRPIEGSKSNQVEITLELENVSGSAASAQIVLLLEDAGGSPLERISLDAVRVPSGRVKSEAQRTRVEGDALLATARLYLFCEIAR